jgi:Na+-transporting NADH:ubiquinone oxidoreductase subunit A
MVERFEIVRGLTIPVQGAPSDQVEVKETTRVGIVASDYIGMRPTMLVSEGEDVIQGQPLFEDKKTPGVVFTAPVSGRVLSVNRGEKRAFQSVIIERQGNGAREFRTFNESEIRSLDRADIVEQLVDSGLWTSLRVRPLSKVPSPSANPPFAVFVNAMDSSPLALDPASVIGQRQEEFQVGLQVVSKLTQGKTYLCRAPGSSVPGDSADSVTVAEFDGPHPAGLVGTHMHFLAPVSARRSNWYLGYQDVIAIGALFLTGRLDPSRLVALAGPSVNNPRILRTQLGADLNQLTDGELSDGIHRVISGSVLNGRTSQSPCEFLGRYSLQVSVLPEGIEREFLGWQKPGFDKFSLTRVFASAWTRASKFAFTTSTQGSERAMVPIGLYEKVMPLDLIPTLLLRSLISRDTAMAQDLGCLELDEEDLALCTFVCPGKYDYGDILRDNLLRIEKEG